MTRSNFFKMYGFIHNYTARRLDWPEITILEGIKHLAAKHNSLAVMSCNGEGTIQGQRYYTGKIDDYARATYGNGVKSAYLTPEAPMDENQESIFDKEKGKIEAKIQSLIAKLPAFTIQFQGDPRGNTVKLFFDKMELTEVFFL